MLSARGNQDDHLLSKCAAGTEKGSQHDADCLGRGLRSPDDTIIAQVYLLKRAIFVLFRPILSCSLLICPVGCYALLFVGTAGRMLSSGGRAAEVLGNTYIV